MKKIFIFVIFIFFLVSCIPQELSINIEKQQDSPTDDKNINKTLDNEQSISEEESQNLIKEDTKNKQSLKKTIQVMLPLNKKHEYITNSLINALEIATYDLKDSRLRFDINYYNNENDLINIFMKKSINNSIIIGPLTSDYTKKIKQYCNKNIIVFSFASDRSLAGECVYLFNFFIEDDLRTIFQYFDQNNKVALLYPDNNYGKYLSKVIDEYSSINNSALLYKLSYKNDLSDVRTVIKQLGKYEYRKSELERQKKLLKLRNDETSLSSLKKLEKFETIGELDFDSLIISEGNIRLLELAPLLPFYDIDPNKIQFVGTGLWDEKSFFDEPSLQGAIFPGVEEIKRKNFFNKYKETYQVPPPRTATLMYDLAALVSFLLYADDQKITEKDLFRGIDGDFSFENNIIKRNLSILKIQDGKAVLIN